MVFPATVDGPSDDCPPLADAWAGGGTWTGAAPGPSAAGRLATVAARIPWARRRARSGFTFPASIRNVQSRSRTANRRVSLPTPSTPSPFGIGSAESAAGTVPPAAEPGAPISRSMDEEVDAFSQWHEVVPSPSWGFPGSLIPRTVLTTATGTTEHASTVPEVGAAAPGAPCGGRSHPARPTRAKALNATSPRVLDLVNIDRSSRLRGPCIGRPGRLDHARVQVAECRA